MNAADCIPHLYPHPTLSDLKWCRVVNALLATGTKADMAIAMNLTVQIEESRERYRAVLTDSVRRPQESAVDPLSNLLSGDAKYIQLAAASGARAIAKGANAETLIRGYLTGAKEKTDELRATIRGLEAENAKLDALLGVLGSLVEPTPEET